MTDVIVFEDYYETWLIKRRLTLFSAGDELLHMVDGAVSVRRQEGVGLDGEEVPALLLALEFGGESLGVHLDGPLATVHPFDHVNSNSFCRIIKL